ncbi:MAG: redoxin domain-containing protein [Bacteroidaceae bacterium]|nr:redoxin domain-containing protein [Bacteroidaceae bacterium]
MKHRFPFFAVVVAALLFLGCGNHKNYNSIDEKEIALLDTIWQRQFSDAQGIIALYDSIKQTTAEEKKGVHTLNQCHFVWNSGEYMFSCRGKNGDIYELPKQATRLSFDDTIVAQFANTKKIGKFADHYFTLQAMKKGDSFNESRDGITATVFYPIRALNDNDYNKLHTIFTSKNKELHDEYLARLKFPLQNSGCTDGLKSVQPLIEKNVADSELKQEILALYDIFTRIMPGNKAPLSTLKDANGKEYTFADFKGKVLVIDVWATWCHSCLSNMHRFTGMRYWFKKESDVCFITVSIDRSEDKEQWLEAIGKHNMKGMLNLFPDCSVQSQFESDFQISGVPRYIIIGKQGEIISAHAPAPGPEMAAMIEKARFAEFYTGPGTDFQNITLDEAIEKASKENKHIFIECHTDGCVPCKMMKDKVFPHNKVAEYLNREFISLSIDNENGEGPRIMEEYDIKMFHTYIILEPNGKFKEIIMTTETDIDLFIEKIEQIKNRK